MGIGVYGYVCGELSGCPGVGVPPKSYEKCDVFVCDPTLQMSSPSPIRRDFMSAREE